MAYDYAAQRVNIFSEDGQRMFLKVRDAAKSLTAAAGAVRMDALMRAAGSGDAWDMLACADRLVELGELVEVPNNQSRAGQHRLFVAASSWEG